MGLKRTGESLFNQPEDSLLRAFFCDQLKKKQAIPLSLLHDVKNHRTLLVWLRINQLSRKTKSGYSATIYNFTYQTCADKLGYSYSHTQKHIDRLIALGYASINNGNLCLKGLNKLDSKFVVIPICKTRKQQLLQFRFALINANLIKQNKVVERKANLVSKANTEHARLTPKQIKFIRSHPDIKNVCDITPTTLSNYKFGKLIGKSAKSGQRLQKDLNKAKLIKSTQRFEVILPNLSFTEYLIFKQHSNIKGLRYSKSSGVIRQLSNQVKMAECF